MDENKIVGESDGSSMSPQVTEEQVAARAMEQGWRPHNQWEGNPADWIDAKEFIRRGELFGKIKDLNNELRRRDQQHIQDLHMLQREMQLIRRNALEQAKAELEGKLSVSESKEEVLKITKDLAKVDSEIAEVGKHSPTQTAPIAPEFTEWQAKNDWYGQNVDMSLEADTFAAMLRIRNPNVQPKELLEAVDKKMKKDYPEVFGVQKKVVVPPSPEAGDKKSNSEHKGTKFSRADLPEEHRRVMDTFVKRKVLTEEQYLQQYFNKEKGV